MSNINVKEIKGKKPGKTIVILAGVHGDETCGVRAFDFLIPRIKIDAGKVFFIYANLKAIKQNKRFVEKNLNRCFFKEQLQEIKNSLEGKTAREIMPYLDQADVMLDIHASFTDGSIPFVICDELNIQEAHIFEAEKIVCNIDPFEPGSTDYYMNLQKKAAFCFECGYLGDFKTNEIAQKAIFDFLIYYNCIPGSNSSQKKSSIIKIVGLYKNKYGPFILSRYFKDFEMIKTKTLIGFDGEKKIYGEKGNIVLFARDRETLNDECFLIGEDVTNVYTQLERNIIKSEKIQSDKGVLE